MARRGPEFIQEGPELGNQYRDDEALRTWLAKRVPAAILQAIEPGLDSLGARAAGEMLELTAQAEAQPPLHVPYDAWGLRVDHIEVSHAWKALHRIAAEEGIVATAFERSQAEWSRLHQFVRLHLYTPSSAIYSCPLAMTDGAARVIELFGDAGLRKEIFPHLISRDPAQMWTSGQWMTERTGGSDVSGTSTEARSEAGEWRLYGTKWFTSATTSEIAVTLAQDPDAGGKLSLYLLRLRDTDGKLNHIFVHRLKDKLGTRALPTAELTLQGTPAVRIGEPGKGVRQIATVLNITRLYNAVSAVSYMRRGIVLATDYAHKRRAFGRLLADQPLHRQTLEELGAEYMGALHLVLQLGALLGRTELGKASPAEAALLRLLTPIAKLYTAKQSISVASEVLECFGGAGYVEDTGLPRLLRDCQVLSIWEGTTNVLSLDVLRALENPEAFQFYTEDVNARLAKMQGPAMELLSTQIREALSGIGTWLRATAGEREALERGARRLSFNLASIYISVLLGEACAEGWVDPRIVEHWCFKLSRC
ncbi:MAG TPA: acyl-CoA dehydrogenase family protein [Gammaproteobacteria bacterium]|nr:acyl-CoA dehydrogenase family protein [Gammaproteobacteria bacterium]